MDKNKNSGRIIGEIAGRFWRSTVQYSTGIPLAVAESHLSETELHHYCKKVTISKVIFPIDLRGSRMTEMSNSNTCRSILKSSNLNGFLFFFLPVTLQPDQSGLFGRKGGRELLPWFSCGSARVNERNSKLSDNPP